MLDPTTLSLTVDDTKISPGPARADTRAPMWTAIPATSSPRTSISPVWIPARTPMSNPFRFSRMARAHSIAPPGAVEGGHEAVAHGLHFTTAEPFYLSAYALVVTIEEVPPACIPELGRPVRGAHDVGEHHGRQDSFSTGTTTNASQELFYVVEHRTGIADPMQRIDTRKFDVLGASNVLRQIATVFHDDGLDVLPVDDQRGHIDLG